MREHADHMVSLAGKVAIITGAGQGVGRGIALPLARRGARVALLGRTVAKVEAVAHEIQQLSEASSDTPTALALACDVKDGGAIADALAVVAERFGGVDVLVNNAQEVPLGP